MKYDCSRNQMDKSEFRYWVRTIIYQTTFKHSAICCLLKQMELKSGKKRCHQSLKVFSANYYAENISLKFSVSTETNFLLKIWSISDAHALWFQFLCFCERSVHVWMCVPLYLCVLFVLFPSFFYFFFAYFVLF